MPATATAALEVTGTLTTSAAGTEATGTITAGGAITNPVIIAVVPTLEAGGATETAPPNALPTAVEASEQTPGDAVDQAAEGAVNQAAAVPAGVPPTGISVGGGMRPLLVTFGVMAGLLLVVLGNGRRRT